MRDAPERVEEVGAILRGIESFQVIEHCGKKTGQLIAGLSDEGVGWFFGEKLRHIQFLGFFKMIAGPIDVAAGHVLDAGNGMFPENPVVAGDCLEVQPVGIALGDDRVQVPGALERFAESTEGGLEIFCSALMVASRPEQFQELIAVHPLVTGDEEVAEKETCLLALP